MFMLPQITGDAPTVALVDNHFAKNMSKIPKQAPVTPRGSSIAEKRGETFESKFWETYKKVSNEYDKDFLERANSDMGIILTFAGLFSAVNSTFIIAMQPNPADTTNALMVQMISIMVTGPDAVNISTLSSATTYSSSNVWVQTLSYASLALSLLAAFGAVLGKQWLDSYKASCRQGSLEERGAQRQRKFDGLKDWQLRAVLRSFLVLLQISLLLFGLSLSANMWTQQTTIAKVITGTTAFGIVFYMATIIVSILFPYSPYHTAESALMTLIWKMLRWVFCTVLPLIVAIPALILSPIWALACTAPVIALECVVCLIAPCLLCCITACESILGRYFGWIPRMPFFLRVSGMCVTMYHSVSYPRFLTRSHTRSYKSHKRLTGDPCAQSSSIRWLLEISTDPAVIDVAVEMIPLVQWTQGHDASAICARLLDTLTTSHCGQELFVKCRKVMAYLCVQSVKINKNVLLEGHDGAWRDKDYFIHDAFMDGCHAWDGLNKPEKDDATRQKLEADTRTALRTMVAHGVQGMVSLPDDDKVIWEGDLRWHENGERPSPSRFDWLIDYLVEKMDTTDDETQGDALLALSAMDGLGSDAKRAAYVGALIHCMQSDRPSRVRYAALRAVFNARKELSRITEDSMPNGINVELLDGLSSALLAAVGDYAEVAKDSARECCYLRFILALTKEEGWRQRLTRVGHVNQWISLISDVAGDFRYMCTFSPYIAGIYMQVNPDGDGDGSAFQETWGTVMRHAWCGLDYMEVADEGFGDCLEMLPSLVKATRQHFHNYGQYLDMPDLHQYVNNLLRTSQKCENLRGVGGDVLSEVQDFSNYLRHWQPSRGVSDSTEGMSPPTIDNSVPRANPV